MMKRRLCKLGLLILAGAIVNVAVAWGCACYAAMDQQGEFDADTWPAPMPATWPAQPIRGWRNDGVGISVEFAEAEGPEPGGHWEGNIFVAHLFAECYRSACFKVGWPNRSMTWTLYDM